MASKATEKASRLTTALTGLGLAVGIAREATDAVPIVKQCLGSAVPIVAFAEKMDKDRQALRELADKSLQLARQVRDVMAGKTIETKVATSLERILKALESIEAFMQKHLARSRLYRLIGYAFTVPQHVGRLSRELTDAVQELIVVALLDINYQVHAAHTAADDNARFAGEFRLLRHCEVQKLDALSTRDDMEEAATVVRYHSAYVDGQLLVVRYLEGITPAHASSVENPEDTIFKRVAFHDCILEEISTVQRSHPNVARIYGWSRGSNCDRFTVFKSGFRPLYGLLDSFPEPIITGIRWTLKVLDAVHHLQLMGIFWDPGHPPYALDDQLQPIIGLENDLGRMDQDMDPLLVAHDQIFNMTLPLREYSKWHDVPPATIQKLIAGCPAERLTNLLGTVDTPIRRYVYVIPRADFSDSLILPDGAAKGLLDILEEDVFNYAWRDEGWTWANILLALDENRSHPLIGGLRVVYFSHRNGSDYIRLYGMDQDSERIVHDMYTFSVPDEQQEQVREMFGIVMPSGQYFTGRVIATSGPGTYRAPGY